MAYKCPNNPKKLTGSFLGYGMSQNPEALISWENVLREHRFKRFIDIGTWKGGLSLYFYLWCLDLDADFYSYDIRNKCFPRKGKHLFERLKFYDHFFLEDVFKVKDKIIGLIKSEGQTIIFCDNGNKEMEFETFAPHLKTGDIIAVHDWKTETRPEFIYPLAEKYNFREVYTRNEEIDPMTRFFLKK